MDNSQCIFNANLLFGFCLGGTSQPAFTCSKSTPEINENTRKMCEICYTVNTADLVPFIEEILNRKLHF